MVAAKAALLVAVILLPLGVNPLRASVRAARRRRAISLLFAAVTSVSLRRAE
jgi:hypothetical protein